TFKQGSKDWLNARSKVITGTEISTLFGLNKHLSVPKLLKQKYENIKLEDNEFLRAGRILEPGIIIALNEIGIKAKSAAPTGKVKFIIHTSGLLGSSLDAVLKHKDH